MTWVWIVVFIAIIIGSIFLLQIVLYFLMKRAMKITFSELDKLVPIEKDRFNKIKENYFALNKNHRITNESIKELIMSQDELVKSERIDMQQYKNQNDFLIMYLLKFMKEKKLKMKDEYSPIFKELESISYFEVNDKSTPYYSYNKKANRYNTLANLSFVSNLFKRNNYYRAPIL